MALKKRTEVVIKYKNERLDSDETFKNAFSTLPQQVSETVIVDDAYSAVEYIDGNKNLLSFTLTTYTDDTKECVLHRADYTFTPDVSSNATPNFMTQAYNYLKNLPEFLDAIDC